MADNPDDMKAVEHAAYMELVKESKEYHDKYGAHMEREMKFMEMLPILWNDFKAHCDENVRQREEDLAEREKRDKFYATQRELDSKKMDDRFNELHDAITPTVQAAVVPVVEKIIDPVISKISKYLFGNGDDKDCMARRTERIEEYIKNQQKSKQLNWISTAQIITWALVIISVAINLFK